MKNPFKNLRYQFSLQSAIDEGFAYERKKSIVLSAQKKQELMESSSLETPRSNTRAIWGVLKPYVTESSRKEKIFAASLLGGSLFLNYFSVEMMADFGNWLSGMTNTVKQLVDIVTAARPDIIADVIDQYPQLQDSMQNMPLLEKMIMYYPDKDAISYDPAFREMIENNIGLQEALRKNPTLEELLLQHPDFAAAVEQNPELLEQVSAFRDDLSSQLRKLPAVIEKLNQLVYICGGAFVENAKDFATACFESIVYDNDAGFKFFSAQNSMVQMFTESDYAGYLRDLPEALSRSWDLAAFDEKPGQLGWDLSGLDENGDPLRATKERGTLGQIWEFMWNPLQGTNPDYLKGPLNEEAAAATSKFWHSKDMATIALKFTAAAVASYKATQFLVLRWRSWSTGYFTKRWTEDNAMLRVKEMNNIDNPGQRIQEDPGHFAGASVSLLTGVTRSGMTLGRFSSMLWGMGPVAGVTGGFFWIGAAYAATLTALTYGVAHKLPNIFRNKQRVEANLRKTTDNIHNNAEQIALTESAEAERDLVKRRVPPVMQNSMREIGTTVKMITLNATVGNMSIPLPYVVASFAAVAGGTASFGTIQTLNYAFNQVNSSLSFIIDRFEQISSWMATSQRMYALDQGIELAHYLEEEKRQATAELNQEINPNGGDNPPSPNGP